ncbi:MAG: hypothetical protein MUD10_01580 [Candidatus Pacebacteria bacterium]|nr:hypothetical protein [Candidatus Paceibacterota bacterium]
MDQVNLKWQLGERHDWIIQYEGRIMWTGNAKVFFIEDVADGGTCWASIRHKNYFGSPWKFYNIECHVRSIKENVSKGPELVKPQEINVLI